MPPRRRAKEDRSPDSRRRQLSPRRSLESGRPKRHRREKAVEASAPAEETFSLDGRPADLDRWTALHEAALPDALVSAEFVVEALQLCARIGDWKRARRIFDTAQARFIEWKEESLALLLDIAAGTGDPGHGAFNVLNELGRSFQHLKSDTIQSITSYFTSWRGSDPRRRYDLSTVMANEAGYIEDLGRFLGHVQLSPQEQEDMSRQVKAFIYDQGEQFSSFSSIVSWLHINGPFGTITDAHSARRKDSSRRPVFDPRVLCAVVNEVRAKFPRRRHLLVLHEHKTNDKSHADFNWKLFIKDFETSKNKVLCVPSNFRLEWIWFYAALRGDHSTQVITSHPLSGSIFDEIREKELRIWKESHVTSLGFEDGFPQLGLPHKFSKRTQYQSIRNWFVPYFDNRGTERWLCARVM